MLQENIFFPFFFFFFFFGNDEKCKHFLLLSVTVTISVGYLSIFVSRKTLSSSISTSKNDKSYSAFKYCCFFFNQTTSYIIQTNYFFFFFFLYLFFVFHFFYSLFCFYSLPKILVSPGVNVIAPAYVEHRMTAYTSITKKRRTTNGNIRAAMYLVPSAVRKEDKEIAKHLINERVG